MCGIGMCSHYDCNYRNGSGYCGVTTCIHPEYRYEGIRSGKVINIPDTSTDCHIGRYCIICGQSFDISDPKDNRTICPTCCNSLKAMIERSRRLGLVR